MKWSPNQQLAIEKDGSNILVSAGAGSGKTAVLTERIYQLVKKGTPISKFLVLTFTNAASAEMKQRIRKKLLNDPECAHMAGDIENAHIETFDAFSLFLVKKYSYKLGISNDISNVDQSLVQIKLQNVITELFEQYYESEDEVFSELISKYCGKNDDSIREFLISVCTLANKQLNKYKFLDDFIDTYFNEEYLAKIVEMKYEQIIEGLNIFVEAIYKLEDAKDATNLIESLEPLLACKNYDELYQKLLTYQVPKKVGEGTDKKFRDSIKSNIEKFLPKNGDFGTKQEIIDGYMSNKKLATLIIDLTRTCLRKLDQFKKERNAYCFDDIALMAVKIIEDPEIANEMKQYFQYILVDEYQDTSDIQERVITAIGKDNIYMVGDVKQSIYKFRNANCSIFQEKFVNYKKGNGGLSIDLNTSYRSRKEVVDMINELFSVLMDKKSNPIDYNMGHHFEFGREEYNNLVDEKHSNYLLEIPTYTYVKNDEANKIEIDYIAKDIIDKINNHYKVADIINNKMVLRDCTFKDFAIIIDKKKTFDDYKKAFTEHNIPLKNSADEGVVNTTVALTVKNLVTLYYCVSNNDFESDLFIHSFVGLHRSFLVNEEDQKIYDYVSLKAYKLSPEVEKMIQISEENTNTSIYSTLCKLYEKFDIYKLMPTIGNVVSNIEKIETLLDLAKNMDILGYKLSDFVQYFKDLDNFKLDMSYSDTSVSENAVEIMTIHHSKGLEYPICYFPGLYGGFPKGDLKTSFYIDKKYGMIFPIVGETEKVSLFSSLFKRDAVIADYEERIRVLYVALTRAKERIIIPLGLKELETEKVDVRSINTFRDMLIQSGIVKKYAKPMSLTANSLNNVENNIEAINFITREIEVPYKEITKKRASKERSQEVSEQLLEFGNEIHYLLEVVDYETKDTSFIKNERNKKYIENVLNLDIFKDVKNSQMRHEFSYYDQTTDTYGIIDCLIIREDSIDIIDFKLKNLDDEKYTLQLNAYRGYIESNTTKKVNTYLVSVIDGKVVQIGK